MRSKWSVRTWMSALILAGVVAGCRTAPKEEELPRAAAAPPAVSPGTKFGLLPKAVQQAIRSQAGAAEIKDINKLPGADRGVYEVSFAESASHPSLFVTEDGTVLAGKPGEAVGAIGGGQQTSMGGNLIGSLPSPVQTSVRMAAPNGVISSVNRVQRNVYEINFQDPASNPPIAVADDGTILKEAR